jgi:hypothetical protein
MNKAFILNGFRSMEGIRSGYLTLSSLLEVPRPKLYPFHTQPFSINPPIPAMMLECSWKQETKAEANNPCITSRGAN